MNKMTSIMLMITGIVFMGIISIIYSFSTIEISTGMYMILWCICVGMIRFAAGSGCGFED